MYKNNKRVVKLSKYERKDRESVNYWLKVFKELEDKARIPYVERSEDVIQCIPYNLYEKIAPLLGLDTKLVEPKNPKYRERRLSYLYSKQKEETKQEPQEEDEENEDLFFSEDEDDENQAMLRDDDEDEACDLDILVKPSAPRSALKKPAEIVSPYYSFVRKKGKRAVNWESRYMPKHVLEDWEKTLHQRATEKTESIVREFCEWLRSLGGQESVLTETALHELFEIGRVDDAAQALVVRVRELYTVTPEVAMAANLPERAIRPTLHRQVMRDEIASMQPLRHYAFGTSLPKDMRRNRVITDTKEWMTCRNIPKGLASMRLVWEGITAIRATRAYCTWLRDHPEIEPPEYLYRIGMMDLDFGVSKGQPRVSMIPEWVEPEEQEKEKVEIIPDESQSAQQASKANADDEDEQEPTVDELDERGD